MTSALLRYMVRPAGPSNPLISFDMLLKKLGAFNAGLLAMGLADFGWKGWAGEFESITDNLLAVGIAGPLAALALAAGHDAGKHPTNGDIIDLHLESLAVNDTSDDVIRPTAEALARLAITEPIAAMVPSLAAARQAVSSFTLARMAREQSLPARARIDELGHIWWIARKIDNEASHLGRTNTELGMPVPTFVRTSLALLALAVNNQPRGYINLNRSIEEKFEKTYDVDIDTMQLAAFKLMTTRDDLRKWIEGQRASDASISRAPNLLATTPLLSIDEFLDPTPPINTVYLCPSLFHFIGAVRDRVRQAISAPGQIEINTEELYGSVLSEYVYHCSTGAGVMYSVDEFDGNGRRADWLLVNGDAGLIIEVKRALATGTLSRHLLNANGMSAVLRQLYGAYEQCRATASRRNWSRKCGPLTRLAALVLVDEPVGAEGAVVADLLVSHTEAGADPPFEVMSVFEFENAVHALGVQRLVSLIREKWSRGFAGLPLSTYFTSVRNEERIINPNARTHIPAEDEELFLNLGFAASALGARWPL